MFSNQHDRVVKLRSGCVIAHHRSKSHHHHQSTHHRWHHEDAARHLRSNAGDYHSMAGLRALCAEWLDEAHKLSDHQLIDRIGHLIQNGLLHLFLHEQERLTSEEIYLAKTVYGEARGESHESRVAVAWVIRNRVNDGRWGDTYESVVTAPRQFTCWSQKIDPDNYTAIQNPTGPAWNDSVKVAKAVIGSSAPDPVPDATHYYSPDAQAALHKARPDLYPEIPRFATAPGVVQVPNPRGVPSNRFRFFKNVK